MSFRFMLRASVLGLLASVLLMPSAPISAQDRVASAGPQTRAQFAAVPLTSADLPEGYALVGEALFRSDQIAPGGLTGISDDLLVETGFVAGYASIYEHESGDGRITSYATLWEGTETDTETIDASDNAATAFALLEDESIAFPDQEFTDLPLDLGDGAGELTRGTITDADGQTVEMADATFIVATIVVGVTSEGSAEAVLDDAAMLTIAERLEARADGVTNGNPPADVDYELSTTTLNLAPQAEAELQVGFVSASETERIYGLSGSALSTMRIGWVSATSFGGGGTQPYVVVGKTAFDDPEAAGRVVEQSADLVPFTIALTPQEGFTVAGADSIRGYAYVSPLTPDGAEPNSFRAIAQQGDDVIIIDVQATTSVDEARNTVTTLMTAQLACTPDACEAPELTFAE